jgi:serine/threonine-protein kinase
MSRADPTKTVPPAATPSTEDLPRKVQISSPDRDAGPAARYETKRVIGEGGMGKVSLVQDQTIGRQVALKELRAGDAGDAARARFTREALLQGQLEHPAIVPVYDVGTRADGSPFFTMKRVRGQSLAEVLGEIARGGEPRYSRRKLLSAFSQLCVAVHYAHERGVVHRDIKPANIMLGAYGEVYLLDWGVAKVAGEGARDDSSEGKIRAADDVHTGFGSVMGTVSTMAPEQAVGGAVDARADVYALGAVLFELLTLQPLHPKGDFDDVAIQIVAGVEARPSVRAPEADVPPELEALCVEATRVQPGDRIASALILHEAIEAYLDGDRDEELRRRSAAKHAEAAKVAADALLARSGDEREDEAVRTSALREVGRALALDPGNKDALGTLVRVLTSPPRVVPREVRSEQAENLRRRTRIAGIACAVVYGYISLNALSTWQLGVREVAPFVTAHVLWACAFVTSLFTIWKRSYVPLFITFLFGVTTCVYVTGIYSPFLMVPTLLTMHAVLFALVQHRWLRVVIIGIASGAWTLSVFGELWGLFPDTVRFVNGDMLIHSPVIDLPETRLTIYLYASMLAAVVAPALVISALRGAWQKNDEVMRLQAWQLRRLVSDEASPGSEPTRPAA